MSVKFVSTCHLLHSTMLSLSCVLDYFGLVAEALEPWMVALEPCCLGALWS